MQSLVTHAGILFRWYTFRNVASAWLTTSISTSTQVLVLVLKFRRAVSSCLETDTLAGDSTLSKRRGRGLEGLVAFGVQPERGILRASRGREWFREGAQDKKSARAK